MTDVCRFDFNSARRNLPPQQRGLAPANRDSIADRSSRKSSLSLDSESFFGTQRNAAPASGLRRAQIIPVRKYFFVPRCAETIKDVGEALPPLYGGASLQIL